MNAHREDLVTGELDPSTGLEELRIARVVPSTQGSQGLQVNPRRENAAKARSKRAELRRQRREGEDVEPTATRPAFADWTDSQRKAASTILGGSGQVSMQVLEKLTGATAWFLTTLVPLAAQIVLDVQEKQFAQLLEAIQTDVGAGRLRGIVYVHFRGHDETPSVCREIVAESGETHASKSCTGKVLAMRAGWSMALATTHGPTQEYLQLHGVLHSRLCSMQSQTAENLLRAIHLNGWLPDTIVSQIEEVFPLRGVVALTDSLAATLKAERAFAQLSLCEVCRSGTPCTVSTRGSCWKHSQVRCRIHRAHTSHKITSDLHSGVVSGLINTTVFLRSPGVMDRLRSSMRRRCDDVEILHGPLPPSVSTWRKSVEDCFMQKGDSPRTARTRVVWDMLFNGDGRQTRVQHYERGCCKDIADTISKMRKAGIDALMSPCPDVYPRKSWQGADSVLDALGMAEATHHLFSRSLLPEMANPMSPATVSTQGDTDFHAESTMTRVSTKRFVSSPTMLCDLIAQRRVASVFSGLKYCMLRETSEDWQFQQVIREAQVLDSQGLDRAPGTPLAAIATVSIQSEDDEESREATDSGSESKPPTIWQPSCRHYRGAAGFREDAASKFFLSKVSTMLHDKAEWQSDIMHSSEIIPHRVRAQQHQDAFRMLSRAGACIQEYVSRPEQGYPQKLIATLERPELMVAVGLQLQPTGAR